MTSLWEGMPISLLEAMYLRKPCVVSNVVGNRDVINDGENGFVCNNVDEFVEKIQYLINNADARVRMGEQGRKDIETYYTSQIMEQKFSEAYTLGMNAIKEWHKQDIKASQS